ncbi:MAG: catechol 2,3-dioxygenase [Gaiellales bacterium]|jgi:catechol 2,3-dioxygenase|nr:catechol 2,3-dioxygenase [Gaiellales bacterium]
MSVPIPDATHMGAVHLTVADLERSLAYYRESIGLEVLAQGDGGATLGAGRTRLLELVEEPGAQPAPGRTGLFHFALLLPDRKSLARWLAHAVRERVRLAGASDHFVSEAIYLSDPDKHGIEIYHDRPRELWEGRVAARMGTDPLDLNGLLGELEDPETEPFERQPEGTTMGHVHLQVAHIAPSLGFYRDVLGFGLMAEYGGQAVFLSAGGYHHHVGANTWRSGGALPPEPGSAALRRYEIVLPDEAERDALAGRIAAAGVTLEDDPAGPVGRDPSSNAFVLLGGSH